VRALSLIATLALILCGVSQVWADAYIYEETDGKIVLTDRPRNSKLIASISPDTVEADSSRKAARSNTASKKNTRYFTRYGSIIKKTASKYRLDHKLVSAVIQVESQFNPMAVSKSGAKGLMQLMPSTARQLGVIDPHDPSQNIEGGTKYLRYLIERFKGDVTLALAAYNSGPLNVDKYGKVPPFKETKKYIKKIYTIYKGNKRVNLSATNGITIRRVTMDDGSVVYTDYLQNGSPSF